MEFLSSRTVSNLVVMRAKLHCITVDQCKEITKAKNISDVIYLERDSKLVDFYVEVKCSPGDSLPWADMLAAKAWTV